MILRLLISISLLLFILTGCAWENVDESETAQYPIWEVRMVMEGSLNANLYYIIAFNFSGDETLMPFPEIDGEDRGRNWDVYYMYGKPGDRPEVATKPLGFYKGIGSLSKENALPIVTSPKKRRQDPTKPVSDENPLDILPIEFDSRVLEFLNAGIMSSPIEEGGASVPNNTVYIRFNWKGFSEFPFPPKVNMNMMVSSLGVDKLSFDPNWDIDVVIWDSFWDNGKIGVTLPITEHQEFTEKDYPVEVQDEYVEGFDGFKAANIVDWSVTISQS